VMAARFSSIAAISWGETAGSFEGNAPVWYEGAGERPRPDGRQRPSARITCGSSSTAGSGTSGNGQWTVFAAVACGVAQVAPESEWTVLLPAPQRRRHAGNSVCAVLLTGHRQSSGKVWWEQVTVPWRRGASRRTCCTCLTGRRL
jgi:hypothetical protein